MDLSIDQLFASLQTTQKAKSQIRLSERNVVELVIKLKQVKGPVHHAPTVRSFISTPILAQMPRNTSPCMVARHVRVHDCMGSVVSETPEIKCLMILSPFP